jgi:hypothetical protein
MISTKTYGSLSLINCKNLKSLGNLKSVEGNLLLQGCSSLEVIDNLNYVSGNLWLDDCTSLRELPNDLRIGGFLSIQRCISLQTLPSGLEIADNLWLDGSFLESIPNDMKLKGRIFYASKELKKMYNDRYKFIHCRI